MFHKETVCEPAVTSNAALQELGANPGTVHSFLLSGAMMELEVGKRREV